MRISLSFTLLALLAVACGASPPRPTGPEPAACAAAQRSAQLEWQRVTEAARQAATPEPGTATPATEALSALEAHVQSLQEHPRELDGEEAMALSNTMMDGIDALGAALPDAERERADDAAEALLTDRSRDGARRSATGALAAFELALSVAQPEAAAARQTRQRAEELGRRAHRAAEGYETGVAEGDRAADRAEAAPLPAGDALAPVRDRATDASRRARESCDVPRTLAAPVL